MQDDRDPSIERLLRDTLRTPAPPVRSGPCLDADTLAAWVDGALTARDRAAAEAHAATCARCQALVAAMIKTSPPPATAPWWRAPLLGWLVPLTAAATAVIAWAVLPDRSAPQKRDQGASAVVTVARAREAAAPGTTLAPPPPANPPSEPARRARPARQVATNPPLEVAAKSARLDSQGARDELQKTAVAPPNDSAFARAGSAAGTVTAQPRSAPAVAAPAVVAPAVGTPAVAAPTASPAPSVAEKRSDQQVPSVAAANATPETTQPRLTAEAAAPPAVTARRAAALTSAFRAAPEIVIVSPDPSSRWRILAGGALQRSVDGGSSWQLQQSAGASAIAAGAAASSTVCWLVGRSGTVLLSTDGRSWRRVAFPETTDLISVRASDARTATVTTVDGRTFTTADGGRTWAR